MPAIDLYGGGNVANALASTAQMASRPSFEMSFMKLQNTLITRINKKIEEVNSDKSTGVDAFKVLEKMRLTRIDELLQAHRKEILGVFNALDANSDRLADLDTALAGAATDATQFDAILAEINGAVDKITPINGVPLGVDVRDGVSDIKKNGLVTVERNGVTVKIEKYSDFADATEAQTAISAAITRNDASMAIVALKSDAAYSEHQSVKKQLTSVKLEIESIKTEVAVEKQKKIKDLEKEYATLLHTLSIVFEGRQMVADQFAKKLFGPPEFEKGSVINMFT